jgi:hypothetical protein
MQARSDVFSKLGNDVCGMASNSSALVLPAQPAAPNTAGDIRDVKGPVHIPSSYAPVWWVLLALVVAAAAYFLWRKLKLRKPLAKTEVAIPPHRKAKDRLRAAGELMSDPYQFCSLVSDVLRTYVEERFDLHAPDRTTEEFMEELRTSQQLHVDHKALLEDFLSRCDLVKFARFEPTEPELRSLLDSALRFVEETIPIAQPANVQEHQAAA